MTAARAGSYAIWTVIMLSSVGVGGYALYLVGTGFTALGLSNPMFDPWGLRIHIAASGVAMLVGAFQFMKPLRQKAPKLHRWTGRIYVAACTIGGLAGGAIALSTTAGPIAGWGFLMLAVFWVPFTLLALAAAMRRDFVSHERWMIRSFALTFGAVTLRIYLPIAIVQNHGEFPLDAYRAIAWLAWVPNLIVAELFILTLRKPKRQRPTVTPTPA